MLSQQNLIIIGTIFLTSVIVMWIMMGNYAEKPAVNHRSHFETMALTAVPGTSDLEMYQFTSNEETVDWSENQNSEWPENVQPNDQKKYDQYKSLIRGNLGQQPVQKCTDAKRARLLSYLNAVYYTMNMKNIEKLTTDQLIAFYRSLTFFFITSPETQPDGGWYGDYWIHRILDQGPDHNKWSGETDMTAIRKEVFPFDDVMTNYLPSDCPAYRKFHGRCPGHAKFFGNRIFSDPMQATMRRGMRNSPQVLAEYPPWAVNGDIKSRFGTGGFPSNVYLEMLQFPQEHGEESWPSGCDATKAKCSTSKTYTGTEPRYQPKGKNRNAGGDPYCGMKPQWFYFSQGLGQFWNLGQTSYCYNYVDLFLNAPMGTRNGKPIGWSSGFSPCSSKIDFPPGSGTLGYDIEDPSKSTEHDYTNPAYSVKLLLEYLSRVDIPGSCGRGSDCQQGLRDPRTGMMGIGFCMAGKDGKCPCAGETGDKFTKCLNQRGPGIGDPVTSKTGCGPTQAVNSRSDALHEQVASLMGLRKGTYWKPYAVNESIRNLNSADGIAGTLNEHGGFDPTDAWAKVRRKNNPLYPKRDSKDRDNSLQDNRYMLCGWINGNFYGYPKGEYISRGVPNPFRGGIAGRDPKTGKVIYGKLNTKDDPLIYYDHIGREIYRTWYGKKLAMDEHTALRLVAEFYSCGAMGFENKDTNWPFGCYFGYGQALGGPGKSACNALSCYPYECTTVQFTSTATAYGSIVQPAYDFEILYMPPVKPKGYAGSNDCTCATSVTLDLTADFNTSNAGKDLKLYTCLNKGSTGGYVYVDSPAGKSAVAFQGQKQKVTNFTDSTSKKGSYNPYQKNKFGVDSNPAPYKSCQVPDYRKKSD